MHKTYLLLAGLLLTSISAMAQISGFEQNNGQIADMEGEVREDVLFRTKVGNVQAYFFDDHVSYYFKKRFTPKALQTRSVESFSNKEVQELYKQDSTFIYRLDLQFENAQTSEVLGGESLLHKGNFYLSHCPDGVMNVPYFKDITYKNVYPNVDIQFHLKETGIKYDIVVRPGGSLTDVLLRYNGYESIRLADNQVIMNSPFGEIVENLPTSYRLQDADAAELDVKYEIQDGLISFGLDEEVQGGFVVDPQMVWSTYYDYDDDAIWGQELDAGAGQVVSLSITSDATMPTLDPGGSAYYQPLPDQPGASTQTDLRILQFNTDGVLLWATYYGGDDQELVKGGIKIRESNGDIYIAAASQSLDFPTQTMGGSSWFESTNTSGLSQIVILRFASTGQRIWSTYFNANLTASAYDIDLSSTGEVFIVGDNELGYTIPTQTLVGAYNQASPSPNYGLDSDGIIISFNAAGVFQWGTYFGLDNASSPQSVDESLRKIKIANNGEIFIAGLANRDVSILQDAGGYYDNTHNGGSEDVLMVKLNGFRNVAWSSYFGGSGNEDDIYGIGVDDQNAVYISGVTSSSDLPTMDPGGGAYFDNSINGTQSGFITKFDVNTNLVWSTYFGSSANDWRTTLDVSANGKVYVAEQTSGTTGMPTLSCTNCYFNASGSGSSSGFIAKFDTTGIQEWGSYVSSAGQTRFICVRAYDGTCGDQVYVSGDQSDTGYPVEDPGGGAYVQSYSGSGIGKFIITQFNELGGDPSWTVPAPLCNNGASISLDALVTGDAGGIWSGPGVTGAFLDPTGLPAGTIQVTYTLGSAPCVDSLQQTITIQDMSVIMDSVTANPDSVCPGDNVILSVNGGQLGTGATWEWYRDACGSNYQGTGTSISVIPSVTSTYFARAEGTCGNTACTSVTVTMKSESVDPASATASANPVCIGDSTQLSVTGGSLGTGAEWTWYDGSCGGPIVGTGSTLYVSPAAATTYFVQAVGDCNTTVCQSVSVSTTVAPTDPTGISATDTSICSGSFTTLSVVGGSLGSGSTWEWYEGSCGGTAVGTGSSVIVSPTTTTTYFVRAEGSCGNTVCVSLTIDVQTSSTSPAGVSTTQNQICTGDSTQVVVLGGQLGTGAEWIWYTGGCGVTAVDTGNSVFVSPTSTTTFYVRAENACGVTACAQVTIGVNPAGDASWVSPGTICESVGTIDLDFYATNPGGTWSGTNVTGSDFNPAGLSGQTITITYIEGNSPCQDTVIQTITVTTNVSASWASPGNVCETNGPIDLDQFVTGSTGGSWNGTGVSGSMFDPTGLNGPIAIEYVVGIAPCADSSTLQVTVISGPSVPVVTVTDTTICEGDTSIISVSNPEAQTNYYLYDAASGGTQVGETDYDASPSSTTTYYVQAEDHNGCYHPGALIPVTITVNPLPNGGAGADEELCAGNSVTLTATGGTDYLWNTGSTNSSITVSPAVDSVYAVTITDSGTGCFLIDSILVNVIDGSDVDAQDDAASGEIGVQITIPVLGNDNGGSAASITIISGPNYGIATISGSNIVYTSNADFSGTDTIYYSICHPTCNLECDTAMVIVDVEPDGEVTTPTGFSPNADGINDFFVVLGIELYPEAELSVFNRWGELVYFKAQYDNSWGGESNGARTLGGEMVPDGTYFFILRLGTGFDTVRGHVEVKRN